jgi:predicted dienelactone hydrolase
VVDGAFGVVGHSFGGWTSLAISGGTLDPAAADAHCAEAPTAGCSFFQLDGVDVSAARPDPRVAATVALAPGAAWTLTGADAIDHALIVGGRLDGDMPYDSEIRPAYEAVGPPKRLLTLARTGHWSFTDLCELLDSLEDCAGEAGGFTDFALVQGWTNTATAAHLRATLLGEAEAEAWLDPARWEAADVSWASE